MYLERTLADAGRLSWMLDSAAGIARRLRDEVGESGGASRAA